MKARNKNEARRERRRRRSKTLFPGHSGRCRLVVYRSLKHIYGQIVNDQTGETLAASSTLEKGVKAKLENSSTKVEQSQIVGKDLAEKATKKKIRQVVFDRNGFLYHGRVKALADGAREGGLSF